MILMANLNEGAKQRACFGMPHCGRVHEIEAVLLSMHRDTMSGGSNAQWQVAEQLLSDIAMVPYRTALERYCEHVQASPLNLAQLPDSGTRTH